MAYIQPVEVDRMSAIMHSAVSLNFTSADFAVVSLTFSAI